MHALIVAATEQISETQFAVGDAISQLGELCEPLRIAWRREIPAAPEAWVARSVLTRALMAGVRSAYEAGGRQLPDPWDIAESLHAARSAGMDPPRVITEHGVRHTK